MAAQAKRTNRLNRFGWRFGERRGPRRRSVVAVPARRGTRHEPCSARYRNHISRRYRILAAAIQATTQRNQFQFPKDL